MAFQQQSSRLFGVFFVSWGSLGLADSADASSQGQGPSPEFESANMDYSSRLELSLLGAKPSNDWGHSV